jgi:hypothetical protein
MNLFGGDVENLTVAEAIRMGTLEFFQDTETGDLIAVLNFLLVDGAAPNSHEDPVTYKDGLLTVYDGLMNGKFSERLWLAEQYDSNTNTGDQDTNDKNTGNSKHSSNSSGCNTASYGCLVLELLAAVCRRGK